MNDVYFKFVMENIFITRIFFLYINGIGHIYVTHYKWYCYIHSLIIQVIAILMIQQLDSFYLSF